MGKWINGVWKTAGKKGSKAKIETPKKASKPSTPRRKIAYKPH